MKNFSISELLIFDPTRQSPKRKPIEIDIQQAKIIAYYPHDVPIEQKCNTVGMAEGVYNFCHTLLVGKESKQDEKRSGWQTIFMDTCTLILSEVQENIWIFAKLDHGVQPKYYRLGEQEDNYYLDQSFTESTCKNFMNHFYFSFKMFYGNIRGWVFKEKFQELQHILTAFVIRFDQIYRFQGKLDILSFSLNDLRMIPLDVNSTLKFSYFKNVLQSYNNNISHLVIYAFGILAFTSLGKNSTHLISKYLFSTGEPYTFAQQHKTRMITLTDMPKTNISQKFGVFYNSKVLGFQDKTDSRISYTTTKSQGVDLLGLSTEGNQFELFDIFLQQSEMPLKVNFYYENNMFFVTFYKNSPNFSQLIFQNRFYHDNADKFIMKISESIPGLLKPNDPYKFIFHNTATYSGKSTIKEWKNSGIYIRNAFELLSKSKEGIVATSTQQGYWIYGVHRFSRILILLVPSDISLSKMEEYVTKMTKQYFTRAYV